MYNSQSEERLSFDTDFWGIVVGGNTLSRGLTIEGLTVSYFVRSSKMYDSLMQMGRWFGYRPGYLDLKRIYITDELRSQFITLASVENEVRSEIRTMVANGDTPLNFRLRVRQEHGLTITAKNKMRSAMYDDRAFSHALVQTRFLSTDSKIAVSNIDSVTNFLAKLKEYGHENEPSFFDNFRKSILYRNISKELINQFLDSFSISPANTRASKKQIQEYITENKKLKNFNFAIVSQISGSDVFHFGSWAEVNLLNRSYAPITKSLLDTEAIYLRSLTVPRDEMIDMGELSPNCPKNADDVSKIDQFKGFSDIRRKLRKDQALIILYPINNNSVLKDGLIASADIAPVKTKNVLLGLTFVFPTDLSLAAGKFVGNKTI